jgi:hypothetical protein
MWRRGTSCRWAVNASLTVIRASDNAELPVNTAIREAMGSTMYMVKVVGHLCDLTKSHTKLCLKCEQPCVECVTCVNDTYECAECFSMDPQLYVRPSARGWAVMDIDESQFNLENIPDWPLIDILHDEQQIRRLTDIMDRLRRERSHQRDMCADLSVGAFMHYAETHEGRPFDLEELTRDVGFDTFVDTFVNKNNARELRDHWGIFLAFVSGRYDFMNKEEVRLGYKYATKVLQTVGWNKDTLIEFQTVGEMMDYWQQWCYSPEHTPEQQHARNIELLEMEAEANKNRTRIDFSRSKYPEFRRVAIPDGEMKWM